MKISVSFLELQMIQEALKHAGGSLSIESKFTGNSDIFELQVAEGEMDDIRDACGDYLLFIGFDEDYNPNSKGRVLEKLIDRFLIL